MMAQLAGGAPWALPLAVAGSVALALSSLIHPLAPFAILGGLWFLVSGGASAFGLMALFLAMVFLRPAEFIPVLAPLKIVKLTAVAAIAATGWGLLVRQRLSWARAPQNALLVLLTGAVVLSCWRSSVPEFSWARLTQDFVKVVLTYFLMVNLIDSRRRLLTIQALISICTALLGAYAVYSKLTGTAEIEGSRAGAVGIIGDPNDLALTLLLGVAFSAAAARIRRGPERLFWAGLLALQVGGILATQSRGGLLGFAVLLYFALRARIKSRALVLGMAAVGGVVLLASAGVFSRETVTGGIDASAQGRLDAWLAGGRMALSHPLLGVGFETFPFNFQLYAVNPHEWRELASHNSFVSVIAETGLLGFVPFCGLVWLCWRDATRLRPNAATSSLEGAACSTLLSTLAGFLVAALFLPQAWNPFLYILMALIVAARRIDWLDRQEVS